MESLPTEKKMPNGCSCILGIPIFLFVAACGTLFLYFFTIRPVKTYLESRSWVETPCVIKESELVRKESVKRKSSGTGTETRVTYKIELLYEYEFQGKSYTGDRYDLMEVSSNHREQMTQALNQLKPGAEAVCYVDPENPQNSIINRDLDKILWILLPLPFVLIGYGGVICLTIRLVRIRKKFAADKMLQP